MAQERLTAQERAEIQALVIDLYESWKPSAGKKTWAAFARHVGVSEYSLQEWRSGRGAPSAINLIRLLGAGAKAPPAVAEIEATLDRIETRQKGTRQDIGRLAKAVVDLTGLVEDALAASPRRQPRKRQAG